MVHIIQWNQNGSIGECPVKVTRETKQTKFRIPEEVLTYLKEQAGKNFRSVNAELMARLVRTMEQDSAGGNNA